MGIDAVALLKGTAYELPSRLRSVKLDDATLVHTGVAFGGDIEMLAYGIRTSIGDALDQHDDPRGVFVLPDVAETRARTYEAVLVEVGEAGEWVRKIAAGEVPRGLLDAPDGSFGALMGQAMQALGGENMAEIQRALASGDYSALEKMQAQMAAAVGGEEALNALAAQLIGAANAEGALAHVDAGALAGFPKLPMDLDELDPEQLEAMTKELAGVLPPEQLAELQKLIKKK
jgi:hypothetical protein